MNLQLLQELKFCEVKRMKLQYDNQEALHIVSNPVFHDRTKDRDRLLVLHLSALIINLQTF